MQAHQLGNGQAIDRAPGRDGVVEQPHFRRAAAQSLRVDLRHAGIHASGIGIQHRFGMRRLVFNGGCGQVVQVQPPNERINLGGRRAEQLGQAPLRSAAQHRHLPQAILCVHEAQGEIGVGVGITEDVRHIGIIADDFDRLAQAFDGDLRRIIRQRT